MKNFFAKIWAWVLQNKVIAIVIAGAVVVGTTCAIVLPICLKHKHEFKGEYKSMETGHYLECECGLKDIKSHIFEGELLHNDENHWKECSICKYKDVKDHILEDAYLQDGENHWKECTECKHVLLKEKHADSMLSHNETHHYKHCATCNVDYQKVEHTFDVEKESTDTLKSEATSTSKAVYYKQCSCGYINKGEGAVTFESGRIITTLELNNTLTKKYDSNSIVEPELITNSTNKEFEISYKLKGADDSTYTNTKPVDAGNYVLKVVVLENETYSKAEKTFEFSIFKVETHIAITNDISKTYDGTAVIDPSISINTTRDIVKILYKEKNSDDSTYSAVKPINAGVYVVKVFVEESNNFIAFEDTKEFTISKQETSIELAELSRVYNGLAIEPVISTNNSGANRVVEYKLKAADDSTYSVNAPKDFGQYTVRVSIEESQNYTSKVVTRDFEITEYRLNFESDVLAYLYNEETKHLVAFIDGLNGEKLAIKFIAKNFGGADTPIFESGTYPKADFLNTSIYYADELDTDITLNYELSQSILNEEDSWQGFKLIIGEHTSKSYVYVTAKNAEELDLATLSVKINNKVIENATISAPANVNQNVNKTYVLEIDCGAYYVNYYDLHVDLLNAEENVVAEGSVVSELAAKPVTITNTFAFNNYAQGITSRVDVVDGILRVGDTITVLGENKTITILDILISDTSVSYALPGQKGAGIVVTISEPGQILSGKTISNNPGFILSNDDSILKIEVEGVQKRTMPISNNIGGVLRVLNNNISTNIRLTDLYVIEIIENTEPGALSSVFQNETYKATCTMTDNPIYIYDGMKILIYTNTNVICEGILRITYNTTE